MSIENSILIGAWILTTASLLIFIPKEKIRQAQVAFLFNQMITWFVGLCVVQLNWIEYPVRWFAYANRASFTFEYFVFPAISALFIVHYPVGQSILKKFIYYASYTTSVTIVEVLLERNTKLIDYIHWDWYMTWGSLFITLAATRGYDLWFWRGK